MSANKAKETKRVRVHSNYVLPSDRHPFSVHLEIVRRYVNLARNTALPAENVEGPGIPVQSAGMNVRFLKDIGLLTASSRGKYSPTEQAISYIYARTADENRAKLILRQVLQNKWFTDATLAHLRTTPVTTREQLLNELALVAQTDRQVKGPALAVLLDYLVYAGIINEDEQGIKLGTSVQSVAPKGNDVKASAPALDGTMGSGTIPSTQLSNDIAAEPIGTDKWHVIQTEDFYIKVKSDMYAIEDLKDAVKMLEKKVKRVRDLSDSSSTSDGGKVDEQT